MKVPVRLRPAADTLPSVEYRWDADTSILSAQLASGGGGAGMSGSVDVEGDDGSWLVLDVADGRIRGVEVAVWPTVQRRAGLAPPAEVEPATASLPARRSQPGITSLELETRLVAEADAGDRTIHFRIGARRPARTVRVACDVLLDVDARDYLAGLWLLNVPPAPPLT